MTGVKCWERNWRKTGGFGDGGDSDWGCGQEPSECSGGIDRPDIGSCNVQGDGTSGKPGGNVDEWRGGGDVGRHETKVEVL